MFIKLTSFARDKKFKINKRINNKWKLEINQFMMDSFAKIYQLFVKQDVEKLGLNKCFNKLVKTEWVTGIEIDEQREIEIQHFFSNKFEFHLATEPDELVLLIEKFKIRTKDIANNENDFFFGEKISVDHLMDRRP